MTEIRCPECEALMNDQECSDCAQQTARHFARAYVPSRERKAACKSGHRFDESNTALRIRPNGAEYQVCIACRDAANAARTIARRVAKAAARRWAS